MKSEMKRFVFSNEHFSLVVQEYSLRPVQVLSLVDLRQWEMQNQVILSGTWTRGRRGENTKVISQLQ